MDSGRPFPTDAEQNKRPVIQPVHQAGAGFHIYSERKPMHLWAGHADSDILSASEAIDGRH